MTLHSSSHREQIVSSLTCPAWCTEPVAHGAVVPGRPAVLDRCHYATVARFDVHAPDTLGDNPAAETVTVMLAQYASADEKGVTVCPPGVFVLGLHESVMTVANARQLAAALLNAADRADSDLPTAVIPVQPSGVAR